MSKPHHRKRYRIVAPKQPLYAGADSLQEAKSFLQEAQKDRPLPEGTAWEIVDTGLVGIPAPRTS